MIIHDFEENEFVNIISNDLVIIDFYADWCGPCKMLSNEINSLVNNNKDLIVLKVNVDKHHELAKKFGVMTIPTLILFKNMKEIKKNIGYINLVELEKWIKN